MGSLAMSDPVLQVDEHRHRGTITLTLHGELDIAGGEVLRARLDELRRTYRGRLVIDLSGLEFVSSTGIAVLMHAHRYARGGGWVLQLRPGPPMVQRVFEIAGLDDRLPFSSD